MNKITTIEGDRLIAEFMGFEKISDTSVLTDDKTELWLKNKQTGEITQGRRRYHASWDWLMDVVEKIESLTNNFKEDGVRYQVSIDSKYVWNTDTKSNDFIYSCSIYRNQHRLIYEMGRTKKEAVWIAVIQFIQWYNQNKTS